MEEVLEVRKPIRCKQLAHASVLISLTFILLDCEIKTFASEELNGVYTSEVPGLELCQLCLMCV